MRLWSRRAAFCPPVVLILVFCFGLMNFAQSKEARKSIPDRMYSPIRLAIGANGSLLVSDYGQGMVLVVDRKNYKIVRGFAVEGKPTGIAYFKGHIYVGNAAAGRIDVYNAAGNQPKKNGSFKTPVGNPTDIAVDPETNRIFAADGVEKNVKIFNTKGNLTGEIPFSDPDHILLAAPTGIAVDTVRQEVLVSDYGDSSKGISPRIQIFNYNGEYVDTITGEGTSSGGMGMWTPAPRFSRPQGLAVDEAGHVFLVDCYASEILIFDRLSGVLLKTLGSFGTDPGQLQLPLDIVLLKKTKNLAVINNRAARVDLFEKGGEL
jgi:DNA-binding beta-propeller fold protein YncE